MNSIFLIISLVFMAQQDLACRINNENLVGKKSGTYYGPCVVGTTNSTDNINLNAQSLIEKVYANVLVSNFRNLVNFASSGMHETQWTVDCQDSGSSGRHYKCKVQGDNLIFSYKTTRHAVSGVSRLRKHHIFESEAYRITKLTMEWDVEVLPGRVLQGGATTSFSVVGSQLTGGGQFTENAIQEGLLKNLADLLRSSCSI